ncbi:serine/threonine-protein kinase [Sorangium sp. So ce131]|uniref:serine/threonine-protein kinase n=1 Tax=Sorangium sp. So ce131 TaxID=3133282 RepID=UPI003F62EC16
MKDEHCTSSQSGSVARRGGASTGGGSSLVRALMPGEHAPGEVLAGKYQILGRLGAGGMGSVWRARSLWLDVDVAIKVIHEEQFDAHAAERLLREARATAKLGHPAIVRVFDFGATDSGEPFLVMELLEGTSLASWLDARGRMTPEYAVQMLLPVACALSAAHAQRVIHRDIKPANILVVSDGAGGYVPKIVDFGIAKLSSGMNPAITQRGMIVGSPEYMSPEQADGQLEIGEQTDVWAFCVVLYELITGRRPFTGDNLGAIISAIFNKEPVPTTQLAAGDEALWAIIRRGLAKLPADRWPTMRALGRALASWAVQRGISADVAGTSLVHQWLARGVEPLTTAELAVPVAALPNASPDLLAGLHARDAAEPALAEPAPLSVTPTGVRGGTIRMDELHGSAPAGLTPPPRLQRALFLGVMAAFVAPVVIIMGLLNARSGSASTGSDEEATTAAVSALARDPVLPESRAPAASSAEPAIRLAPRGEGPAVVSSDGTAVPSSQAAAPGDAAAIPSGKAAAPGDVSAVPSGKAAVPSDRTAIASGKAAVPRDDTAGPSDKATARRAPVDGTRARRAPPSASPRSGSTSMPLPETPDF